MSLFGTLIKQGAKFADNLLDDAAVQAKKKYHKGGTEPDFDDDEYRRLNPPPHQDVPVSERTPDQTKEIKTWRNKYQYAKNRTKRIQTEKERHAREKDRINERQRQHYRDNADRLKEESTRRYREGGEGLKARRRELYDQNRDEINRKRRIYNAANRDRIRARNRAYYHANPGMFIDATNRRKKDLITRTPDWADVKKVHEIYKIKAEIEGITGVKQHVDHVIPLRGKRQGAQNQDLSARTVSGLHHQDNLMIVPAEGNLAKGPVFEPGDQPPRAGIRNARALLKKVKEEYGLLGPIE
jgi:hypothetical protein